jgi:hypothetical protein
MCGANVFIGWQQVVYPLRDQCSQRYLKGQGAKVYIVITTTAWMQVDVVIAHTHTIVKVCCFFTCSFPGHQFPVVSPYVFFQHGEHCLDPS